MKNMFCKEKDLSNEASVEAIFVERLLNELGYPDDKIKRKESLKKIIIGKGSKKENYKPDYVLLDSNNKPKIVIDAKHPEINPADYHYQVSSYALKLNQKYKSENPVLYTIVTNGHQLIVYPWDSEQADLFLRFKDFKDENKKYKELFSYISYGTMNKQVKDQDDEEKYDFYRPNLNEVRKVFKECHNFIWKKEKISPTDAFYEFSKLMFIKLKEDEKINKLINSGKKPKEEDFIFSIEWIDKMSVASEHPFDTILFRNIQEELEHQIKYNEKKRIFKKGEGLNLKASTVRGVVEKIQHYNFHGVDEDLAGRMFETFLNATVRGKALGQFFTPRGVVEYMSKCAPVKITTEPQKNIDEQISYVLDGCCGSGGFLIELMAKLIYSVKEKSTLTNSQKNEYISKIKKEHIFGIDANPKISKISRLNMYLHGDGGSKIFNADTLDKKCSIDTSMNNEQKDEMKELKKYLVEKEKKFDLILTNPPFSMRYSSSDKHEKEILEQYDIARTASGNLSRSEKSNTLFIERYKDLLDEDGELLTVIDDTVLNGTKSQSYRDFILDNFIIIQIISLPFNTFFMADANIKTSILHLRKKKQGETQGNIFMGITNNIGHDDHSRETPERNNLNDLADYFNIWRKEGKIESKIINNDITEEPLGCPMQVFEVKSEDLNTERLDAFYYSQELKEIKDKIIDLEKNGMIEIMTGKDFEILPTIKKSDEKEFENKMFKYFEIGDVTRDGTIVDYRENYFHELPTRARLNVESNDVIFAKNNSSRGTTVLIPEWYDNDLVTTGFIGVRPETKEEALVLWNIFESEIFRKQIYYYSITASQPEIRNDIFENEIMIPWPKNKENIKKMISNAKQAQEARNNLRNSLNEATVVMEKLINFN